MKRTIVVLTTAALAVILAVSCEKLDVVANHAIRSFSDVLTNAPQLVSGDEANRGWSLAAPDGSTRFFWSRSFAESPRFDVMIEFDAAPFVAAGLDPARLPGSVSFNSESNVLAVGIKSGTEQFRYQSEVTPLASFEQIVRLRRRAIVVHNGGEHFGVVLGYINEFRWVRDLSAGDNDLTFTLNPEPFIAAGVDPGNIEGWAFGTGTTMLEDGTEVQVDRLRRRFNLL